VYLFAFAAAEKPPLKFVNCKSKRAPRALLGAAALFVRGGKKVCFRGPLIVV